MLRYVWLWLFAFSAPLAAQDPEPLEAPQVRFEDWGERDDEGRWVLIANDLSSNTDRLGEWVRLLADEGEGQLLAWLALSIPYDTGEALAALVRLRDPHWMAVAVFRARSQSSHGVAASRVYLDEQPALVRAWIDQHRESIPAAIVEHLESTLQTAGAADPLVLAALAPPIDHAALLGQLERGASSVPFGARKRAEEGVLYRHQVQRALHALLGIEGRPKSFRTALAALAHAEEDELAAMAGRACASLQPLDIPAEDLFRLANDPTRSDAAREALFLGASYGEDRVVWVHLHAALDDPEAPLWLAAVHRVEEVGDSFSILRLERLLDREALEDGPRGQVQRALEALSGRELPMDREVDASRAAYARSIGHPLTRALVEWAER